MDFKARYTFDVQKDLLGKGDFSRVYRAKDTLLDRVVALKFYTANAAGHSPILDEIKKGISLDHPNLCKYYGVEVLSTRNIIGEEERIEVGILEYLDGGDFKSYTAAHSQHTNRLLVDVLKGLAYLHERGIVHRDLRAENILLKMVAEKPVAKITNFRNSQLINDDAAQLNALPNAIGYMAPEQFNPEKYGINGRVATNLDLWHFGLLVYETLGAAPLFGDRGAGVNAEQIMASILNDSYLARIDAVAPAYRALLRQCLVKEAAKRVQHAADLIPLLEAAGDGKSHVFVAQQAATPQIIETKQKKGNKTRPVKEPEADQSSKAISRPSLPEAAAPVEDEPVKPATALAPPIPAEVTFTPPAHNRNVADAQAENREQERPGATLQPPDISRPAPASPRAVPVSEKLPSNKPIYPGADKNKQPFTPYKGTAATRTKGTKGLPSWASGLIGFLVILVFIVLVLVRPGDAPGAGEGEKPASDGAGLAASAIGPPMIAVPGGVFLMGYDGKGATDSEKPVHPVLVNDFALGKYEVTVGEFRSFVAATGYRTTAEKEGSTFIYDKDGTSRKASLNWRYDVNGNKIDTAEASLPVVHVSWYDAVAYCKWLSEKTNQHYRLPTEAEWEYAALGGKKGYYNFNDDSSLSETSWNGTNSENTYHQVGGKKPNILGLFDMIGNVYEWCSDWYDERAYRSGKTENPEGPASGSKKVIRGGSWYRDGGPEYYRPTIRFTLRPEERGAKVGFRVCSSGTKK